MIVATNSHKIPITTSFIKDKTWVKNDFIHIYFFYLKFKILNLINQSLPPRSITRT